MSFWPLALKNHKNEYILSKTTTFDPLEQFEVVPVLISNDIIRLNSLAITWSAGVVILALVFGKYSHNLYTKYQARTKALYRLVKSVAQENLYITKQQYFRPIIFLFATILVLNLIGLLPFAFTVTSSFAVTLFLATTHFTGVNLIGITGQRWQFRNLFLPSGVPLAITPFLILIEVVSYLARVLSLSIRLFANRRSGHALLKILIGFALARGTSASFAFNLLAVVPWTIVTAVRFLELLIAFLQSHVFTILVTIYLNDVLSPH